MLKSSCAYARLFELGSVTLKLCEKISAENLEMSTNEMSKVRDGSIGICGEQLVGFERLLD